MPPSGVDGISILVLVLVVVLVLEKPFFPSIYRPPRRSIFANNRH
jgi:hypothetical protein